MKSLFLLFILSFIAIPGWSVEKKYEFLNTLEYNYWTQKEFMRETDAIVRKLKTVEVNEARELSLEECVIIEEKIQKNYRVKFTFNGKEKDDDSQYSLCYKKSEAYSAKIINKSGFVNFNNFYTHILVIERPIDLDVAKSRKKLSHYFLDANFKVVEIQDFIYDCGSKLGHSIKAWDPQKNFYEHFAIGLVSYKTQASHGYKLERIRFVSSDGLKEFQRNNWYPQYSWGQFINEDYMTINEKNWNYLEYNIAQDLWYNINEFQIEKHSKIKTASIYELKSFSPEVLIACESGGRYINGILEKFENRKNEDSGRLQLHCINRL